MNLFLSKFRQIQFHQCGKVLLSLIWAVGTGLAIAKAPTYESYNFPVRYSVAPMPAWFKPLPVAIDSDFHKEEDRYLSRQTAVRVDAKGWTDIVSHEVMEIRSKDHPWVKGPKAEMEPLIFNSREQALVLHALKVHRNGKVIDHTHTARPSIKGGEAPISVPTDLSLRSAYFQLPRLKVGDQVELAYSTVTFQLSSPYRFPIQMRWQVPDSKGLTYPVVLERQLFQWSVARPHRPVEVARDDHTNSLSLQWEREESDLQGWKQVAWTASRVAPMPTEPVTNGYIPNDLLPYDMVGIVEFAEGSNAADEFLQSYLVAPSPSSAAYAALLEQIRREPSSAHRALASLRWVQDNIRPHMDSRQTPMSADEVLAVGKGDCKDVSMLLWQLMRGLGIEAEIAAVNTQMGRLPSRLGAMAWFDHVVVVAWIEGRPYVLDATMTDGTVAQQPMPLERIGIFYANYDLRIANGSRAGYLRIPPSADIEDRTRRIEQRTQVDADDESLTITSSLTFSGALADYWRGQYANEEEDVRRKLFMDQMKDIDPRDKWLEPLKIEDDVVNNRLTLRARTQFGTTFRKSPEGHFLVEVTSQPFFDLITDPSGSETRVTPLGLPFDREQRAIATHTLVLPKGWKAYEVPRIARVEHPAMRVNYTRKTEEKSEGTEVIDTLELNLLSDRVLPQEFPAYKIAVDKALRLTGDIRFGP